MEEITTNAKIVTLDGTELHVHFTSAFPYFWLRNDGSSTVLMSISPNISEGGDGVIEVLAGSSAGTMHGYAATRNDLYLLGSGRVQIMGTYTPENPFRKARKGGENHINDGLAYEFGAVNDTCDTVWSGYQFLYTPFTIEFCGLYRNFTTINAGIGNGRWFVIHNGAQSGGFAASQRENTFLCRIFGTWFDTGETDITIEKNEFVTISMVITQQKTVDLYKNGEFVKSLDIPDNSVNLFSHLVFWNDPFVSGRRLNGIIESFRIYDRELTESDILHNFNVDKALYFKEV